MNRDAKPISSTAKKKLKGALNIIGRMGLDCNMMRKKREDADAKKAADLAAAAPGGKPLKTHESVKTVRHVNSRSPV